MLCYKASFIWKCSVFICLFICLCLKVVAHLFLLFIWLLKVFECKPCSPAGWCERVVTVFLPTIATQTFFWLFAQFHLGYSGKSSVTFASAEEKTSLFNFWEIYITHETPASINVFNAHMHQCKIQEDSGFCCDNQNNYLEKLFLNTRCINEPGTVCLLIPCFMQLFSKLLCAFRELLNGNCITVYLCQLSALLGSIRDFLLS